jgi:hypothetical protein
VVIIVMTQGLLNRQWNTLIDVLIIMVNLGVVLLCFYYECMGYMRENPKIVKSVSARINSTRQFLTPSFLQNNRSSNKIDRLGLEGTVAENKVVPNEDPDLSREEENDSISSQPKPKFEVIKKEDSNASSVVPGFDGFIVPFGMEGATQTETFSGDLILVGCSTTDIEAYHEVPQYG